jgi:hypothetical protein
MFGLHKVNNIYNKIIHGTTVPHSVLIWHQTGNKYDVIFWHSSLTLMDRGQSFPGYNKSTVYISWLHKMTKLI